MSRLGGTFDKLGNHYEGLWTVRCLLLIIEGKYDHIELESIDPQGEGVEFVLTQGLKNEFHQVKRQHREGKWTLSRLQEENILKHFIGKLEFDTNASCHFVSISDAFELRILSDEVRKGSKAFQLKLEDRKWTNHFSNLQKIWNNPSQSTTVDNLKRIHVRTDSEVSLRESNRNFIQRLFEVDEPKADNIADILAQFVFDRLNILTRKSDILTHLSSRDHNIKQPKLIIEPEKIKIYLEDLIEKFGKSDVLNYVNLDGTISTINVEENLQPPYFFRQYDYDDENSDTVSREKISDIRKVVDSVNHLAIIGAPGAGKTTTLRKLAVDVAKSCLANPTNLQTNPIPLYVSLPAWDKELNIQQFVKNCWHFEVELIELLHRGLVILYLDGLNQMGASGNAKVKQLKRWLKGQDNQGIESLAVRAPKYALITCRKEDYVSEFVLNIPFIEVEELDREHIEKFVYSYAGGNNIVAKKFLNQIFPSNKSRSLASLASNPYKLNALYALYIQYGGNLPRNAGLLSKQRIEMLWEMKMKGTTKISVDDTEMLTCLSRLAFAMIDSGMPTTISRRYALIYIDKIEVLEAARDIILIIEGDEIKFDHQLTQEYFAAEALNLVGVSHITLSYSSKISDTDSSELLYQLSDKWDEVVIALSGISESPNQVIAQVARLNPLLANRCLSSGVKVSNLDLIPNIVEALNHPNVNVVGYAIEATAKYNDKRIIKPLMSLLNHRNQHIKNSASVALAQLSSLSTNDLIEELELSYDKSQIASILTKIGNDCTPSLMQMAQDTDIATFAQILEILGSISDPRALDLLYSASQSQTSLIQKNALQALVNMRHQDACFLLREMLSEVGSDTRLQIIKGFKRNIDFNMRFYYFHIGEISYATFVSKTLRDSIKMTDDTDILAEAIEIFEKIGDEYCLDPLCNLVHHTNLSIHIKAFRTLKRLSKKNIKGKTKAKNIVSLFGALRFNQNPRWRKAVDKLYQEFGAIGLIHALRHKHRNGQTYWNIAQEIIKLPERDDLVIIQSLKFEKSRQGHLVYVLGYRDKGFAPYLMEATTDRSEFIRGQAVRALGQLQIEYAVDLLIGCLDDEVTVYSSPTPTRVCDYAMRALENIGTEKAIMAIDRWKEKPKSDSKSSPPPDVNN